ncbi:glycosyltransferase [Klebsiella aerogenes]|uniref:glycosyltransferase family 2 protein n=1 Tax=Klebsiella aerogenes TaxID=548 RepID=UPI001865D61B|nr:glycosyltransferase family A protein [Klebsiella aerogenes]MDG0005263.1 glycosyltransferase [Klebsiella aerogenes]HEP1062504.1 glycosyltransferase family 2 protein [Klebsiella aerogenes]
MKISFVIPAYNAADYIFECVSSIINQKCDGYEVIIINDGSTDNTAEILASFQKQNSNVKVYNVSNGGQSLARNIGVGHAKGEYIFFVDADDLISPDAIDKLYSVLDSCSVDMVFFNGKAFYEEVNLQDEHTFNYIRNKKYYGKSFPLSSFAVDVVNAGEFIAQPCLYIFRRKMFNENSFYPGIIHEDNLFTAKMMLNNAGSCYVLGEFLYMRRVRNDSTMTSKKSSKNIYGYTVCAAEISKLCIPSVKKAAERLSLIWFKESLLINYECNLNMHGYIRGEIYKSNIGFFYKAFFSNYFVFLSFVKIKKFIKLLKKVLK